MADDTELVKKLRDEMKDAERGSLVDAYLKTPTVDAIATRALEILTKETDAIDKP